ncbi:hypothetical protein D9R08_04525 [Rhodophyticola porphyridii]|uniref:Uncharacterized protein n=1 Tax=Rhodophyticola porphyridii TaxID=1852017 RepID=A0A3L9Y9E9_9RHOB|nr:hypothetical protein D9R08_04525 [Rhodophyticola porphyridii]
MNDLRFAETASLHRLSPQLENRLTSKRGLFRGAGHTKRKLASKTSSQPKPVVRLRRRAENPFETPVRCLVGSPVENPPSDRRRRTTAPAQTSSAFCGA